jgi:hypothetical protein
VRGGEARQRGLAKLKSPRRPHFFADGAASSSLRVRQEGRECPVLSPLVQKLAKESVFASTHLASL